MRRRFVFEVPSVPGRAISPNAYHQQHWAKAHREREAMSEAWGWAIKGAIGGISTHIWPLFPDGEVTCTITVYWPPRRQAMDASNLIASFKRGFDQIERQGVVANDRQITGFHVKQEPDPEKKGRVVVELEGE